MSTGSLLSLFVLQTVLGFISWGVIQMLSHGSFGLTRQLSMEQPPGLRTVESWRTWKSLLIKQCNWYGVYPTTRMWTWLTRLQVSLVSITWFIVVPGSYLKQLFNLETQLLFQSFLKLQQSVILLLDLTVCLGLSIVGFTLRKRWHWRILYVKFNYVEVWLMDGFSIEELDYIAFFVCTIWDIFCWFILHSVPTVACYSWSLFHSSSNIVDT